MVVGFAPSERAAARIVLHVRDPVGQPLGENEPSGASPASLSAASAGLPVNVSLQAPSPVHPPELRCERDAFDLIGDDPTTRAS